MRPNFSAIASRGIRPQPMAARGSPLYANVNAGTPFARAVVSSRPPVVIASFRAGVASACSNAESVSSVSPLKLEAITNVSSSTNEGRSYTRTLKTGTGDSSDSSARK